MQKIRSVQRCLPGLVHAAWFFATHLGEVVNLMTIVVSCVGYFMKKILEKLRCKLHLTLGIWFCLGNLPQASKNKAHDHPEESGLRLSYSIEPRLASPQQKIMTSIAQEALNSSQV